MVRARPRLRILPSVAAVAAALLVLRLPAAALTGKDALDAANAAYANLDDYRMTIAVHEVAGDQMQDRTYDVLFKKPDLERIDIVAGPGRGSGIVWLGGDKVKGHRGGLLSGIRLTFDIHDGQVATLRGDSVSSGTIPAMLAVFSTVKGTVSEAPGPQIDGADTDAVTLDVDDPATYKGVSREVLYLSNVTNLPVRRERFAGSQLVKSENVTNVQTNVGLTDRDFPW
jgi:outer membrane lipoprotein-sorting protein